MNEDIYLLLDGDLSDTDSAVLFRQLSESSQERLAFRQQLRLNSALSNNETFNGLTTTEDADLLARLAPSIGLQPAAVTAVQPTAAPAAIAPSAAASWFTGRALVMLLSGFLIGAGIGIPAGKTFFSNANQPAVAQAAAPLPQPMPAATAINRDSLVTALRDSLRTEMEQAAELQKQHPRKKASRRNIVRKNQPVTGE
ncbi:MAG: hypothetical protein IT211_06120 [Armatimonadetes bacterium]|nr:hypothetical protein [Armatimonadota bacterium]